MWADKLPLRPHHGLCMAYFVGEGYSSGFKKHMGEVLEHLTPQSPVVLTCATDEVCSACPHNIEGTCESQAKVDGYDRAVLEACGLADGQELDFGAFTALVQSRIIAPGKRAEICGQCQWNSICSTTPSQWQ